MMAVTPTQRTWRFPRILLEDLVSFSALIWAGYVLVIGAIIAGIAFFGSITGSVWEPASGVPPWFVLFMGVTVITHYLPLFVAHGRTRRDFAIEAAIFSVIYTAAMAVLMVIGYLLEFVVYRNADWPQDIEGNHLFDSGTDIAMIFLENWMVFLVWFAVGALVSAAFYRFDGLGAISLLPAVLVVGLTSQALGEWDGPAPFGFVNRLYDVVFDPLSAPNTPAAVVICLGCFVVTLALTWPIIRDVPIRKKSD